MLFAFFKSFGGQFCLVANTIIILRSDNIEDIIKDFVAVMIIMEIDNIVGATIENRNKKKFEA